MRSAGEGFGRRDKGQQPRTVAGAGPAFVQIMAMEGTGHLGRAVPVFGREPDRLRLDPGHVALQLLREGGDGGGLGRIAVAEVDQLIFLGELEWLSWRPRLDLGRRHVRDFRRRIVLRDRFAGCNACYQREEEWRSHGQTIPRCPKLPPVPPAVDYKGAAS